MNQTGIMLASSREDYSQAMNVLFMVESRYLPVSIENLMYAYMVAKDWCNWIKNPDAPDTPVLSKHDDLTPLYDIFQRYATSLEEELADKEEDIILVFSLLNPNLGNLIETRRGETAIKETTQMYLT